MSVDLGQTPRGGYLPAGHEPCRVMNLRERPGALRRGLARHDDDLDVVELRRGFRGRWLVAHDLAERRHQLLIHEPLERFARLPDVIDVPTSVALARAVEDEPFGRLLWPYALLSEPLLVELVVLLLGEHLRCLQHRNSHPGLLCV